MIRDRTIFTPTLRTRLPTAAGMENRCAGRRSWLTGCAIGEVAGLLIGTTLGWGNGPTIALAVALAFLFGFGLTAVPFLRRGYSARDAARIAFAADAASITIMEIVDNVLMLAIPGAMDAPVASLHFWGSMALALGVAGFAAYPVNHWLIARGKGHAVVHAHPSHDHRHRAQTP